MIADRDPPSDGKRVDMEISVEDLQGVAGRLEEWRKENGLTYRDVQEAVNEELPEGARIGSASTIHKWERKNRRGGQPTKLLIGLKRAYPYLNLSWLLFGEGEPFVGPDWEPGGGGDVLPDPDRDQAIPSLWLRDELPEPAKRALLDFFEEVAFSDPTYYFGEGEDGRRRIDVFRETVVRRVVGPEGDFFAGLEELTDAEKTSYVYSTLSALRPLVRGLREEG